MVERLEQIFPTEREARVAQGILQAISGMEEPVRAEHITDRAKPTIRDLVKGLPKPTRPLCFEDIFYQLAGNGYLEARGVSSTNCLEIGPGSLVVMPQAARTFFTES